MFTRLCSKVHKNVPSHRLSSMMVVRRAYSSLTVVAPPHNMGHDHANTLQKNKLGQPSRLIQPTGNSRCSMESFEQKFQGKDRIRVPKTVSQLRIFFSFFCADFMIL